MLALPRLTFLPCLQLVVIGQTCFFNVFQLQVEIAGCAGPLGNWGRLGCESLSYTSKGFDGLLEWFIELSNPVKIFEKSPVVNNEF